MLQCLREVDPEDIERVEPKCAGYVHKMVAFVNLMTGGGAKMMKVCKADIKVIKGHLVSVELHVML